MFRCHKCKILLSQGNVAGYQVNMNPSRKLCKIWKINETAKLLLYEWYEWCEWLHNAYLESPPSPSCSSSPPPLPMSMPPHSHPPSHCHLHILPEIVIILIIRYQNHYEILDEVKLFENSKLLPLLLMPILMMPPSIPCIHHHLPTTLHPSAMWIPFNYLSLESVGLTMKCL